MILEVAVDDNNKNFMNRIPLGRAFRLKEINGRVSKWLEIPPGRQGVVLYPDGEQSLLPPGRHRILAASDRLRGSGAGVRAGYVPAQPFTAWLEADNHLLSGDDQLMDVSMLCGLEVSDAVRFFEEYVVPHQEIYAAQLQPETETAFEVLNTVTRRYAADDLVHGLPTAQLLPEVQTNMDAVLSNQGLSLISIQALSFSRSEDRLVIAAEAQALQERLLDVDLQRQMVEVETQINMQDFIHQLDPSLVRTAGLRMVVDPGGGSVGSAGRLNLTGASLLDRVAGWAAIEANEGVEEKHSIIDKLLRRSKKPQETADSLGPRQLKRWVTGRAVLMLFVAFLGAMITGVIILVAKVASWESKWEALFIVWAPILAVLVESVIAYLKKREEIAEIYWAKPGITYIDDLTRNNREQVDKLVRDQCSQELLHSRDVLNDVRSRVYRSGDTDLALEIKSLERKFDASESKVLNPDFGRPAYLGDLKINRDVWENMLDFDEGVLVRAAALSQDVHEIGPMSNQGDLSSKQLLELEDKLDRFMNHFYQRSRPLKPSAEEQANYRKETIQA